jgi:hypothetical protein
MGEVLTMKEIEARFPSEWVLLTDPETNQNQEVVSGRLVCHSKDRDEIYRQAMALPVPRDIAVLYTGPAFEEGMEYIFTSQVSNAPL